MTFGLIWFEMTSRQFVLRALIVFSWLYGVFVVVENEELVFVKEGDSVTLYTDVKAGNHNPIKWYFNDSRIAHITGNLTKLYRDKEYLKRFRDRLKVASHAGDLTITNIRNEHAGVYLLQIRGKIRSDTSFNVTVRGVPAAERDAVTKICVKEGESVTLDPGVMKTTNDSLTWHFSDTLIAEITGDQSQICADDQCEEIFRDRLKMNQTGSLTITNTRTEDSGDYILEIIVRIHRRHSITSVESFCVAVIGSGLSPASVVGIVALLVSAAATAGVIYCFCRRYKSINDRKDGGKNDLRGSQQHQGLLTSTIPLAIPLKVLNEKMSLYF